MASIQTGSTAGDSRPPTRLSTWQVRNLAAEAACVFVEEVLTLAPEVCRRRADVAALLQSLLPADADRRQVGELEDAICNLANAVADVAARTGVATAQVFDPSATYGEMLQWLPADVALAAGLRGERAEG